MPIVLSELVCPSQTAIVVCEMQRGVIGDLARAPELVAAATEVGIVESGTRLVQGARRAGARVVFATIQMRADRAGITVNNLMTASAVKNPQQVLEGSPQAEIIPELGPEPEDIVMSRIHGLTPFTGTELDSVLRNLGISTIVPIGVSVNECVMGLCLSAADLGYQIVLPTDGVAGVPREYAEQVFQHTLRLIATLSTVDAVLEAWA
jgi:nicotinamidase-related amidase